MRGFAVLLLLLPPACESGTDGSGGGDNSGGGDASAQLACRDFYDIAGEVDLMTDDELRERLQDLWNTAEVSETPGIAEAARSMLETVTAGDIDSFEVAVGDMQSACTSVEPL